MNYKHFSLQSEETITMLLAFKSHNFIKLDCNSRSKYLNELLFKLLPNMGDTLVP